MADALLFEFLLTEMVAELWPQDPDPARGGRKMNLSVLEGMGCHVGQALGERLPQEMLAFREELDALKFLCKDLWVAVFQKQMDSLCPSHQWSLSMASGLQYLDEAPKFLAFTCGGPRGTLSTLGIESLVTASVAALCACKFQAVIQKSQGPLGHPQLSLTTASGPHPLQVNSRCFGPETLATAFGGGLRARAGHRMLKKWV
ncbi:PREDICTED: trafficking protein particle complex subunit 6A [Galeopterus variegatus]|uniref:Trafficking protein particle complex subunit 6A n=1 Tax=Galeopterus variegatus TaxID=482537 RepID=A0ABM0RW42_GALVR|nr:PREDICTED: trafficking protein particle complex subunit 6A [Galeopterus variegatus]